MRQKGRILGVSCVVLLAVAAGVAGYLVAPRSDSSAAVDEDLDDSSTPQEAPVSGAVVTLARSGPLDSTPTYEVTVLAESAIESVVLRAGGSEIDRFEPTADVSTLSIDFHSPTNEHVDAVVTLADGRSVTSNSLAPAFEPLPQFEEPPDTGATESISRPLLLSSGAADGHRPIANPAQVGSGVTWTGPAELHGGVLTVHEPGVGRVFFYITDDGDNWDRVPSAAGASVPLINGEADLTGQLPALEGSELTLEIWQHDAFPVLLGTARAIADTEFQVAEPNGVFGFLGRLDLDLVTGEGDDEQLVRGLFLDQDEWSPIDLQWGTDLPNVTHIVWQAYNHRPPEDGNPLDTAPSFAYSDPAGGDNRFTFLPPGTPGPEGGLAASANTGQDFLTYGLVRGQQDPAFNDPSLPKDLKIQLYGQTATPEISRSWFLRAHAFSGDQWVGVSSNIVSVHLGKPPQLKSLPPEGHYDLEIVVHAPETLQMQYRQCWEVVDIDEAAYVAHRAQADGGEWQRTVRDYAFLNAIIASNGPVICAGECYEGLDPDFPVGSDFQKAESFAASQGFGLDDLRWDYPVGCSNDDDDGCSLGLGQVIDDVCTAAYETAQSVVQLIGDGWTFVSETYDDIKDAVISELVTISGCELFASEETCNTLATIAVNAGLAAVGLPPSIPTAEQVTDAAKGDLEATLVEFAQQQTGVCAWAAAAGGVAGDLPTCEKLAADLVNAAFEAAKDAIRSDGRNAYGMPFPPGVKLQADPRGTAAPLHVTVLVYPEPGMTLGPTCNVTFYSSITWQTDGKLDLDPFPLHLPNADFDPWSVPKGEYSSSYDLVSVKLPKPADDETPARFDVFLPPPTGPSDATAHRFVDPFWAPPLGFQQWTVPLDMLVLRPGATLSVVAGSPCAGVDTVETVLGQ